MTKLTWTGLNFFLNPERAALYALDHEKDPQKLLVLLEGGRTEPAQQWEIDEVIIYMRDLAPPI